MATTEVEIYNMALSALGTFSSLAATTDRRREAEVCRIWYPLCRDRVLRSAPWSGATAFRRLALLATRDDTADWVSTDPAPGWTYAYGVPNDFIWPRSLSAYEQFEMSMIAGNRVILSNSQSPIMAYTFRQTNVGLWDPELQVAVAYDLAAFISRSLNGSRDDQISMFRLAQEVILPARAAASNLLQRDLESSPDWLQARGGALNSPTVPFIYPSAEYITSGFGNLG